MEWWLLSFIKIVFINFVLSGDNAIVIALASRNLPEAKRKAAVFWGAFLAIAMRVLLTVIAVQLLEIPFVMGLGALLLLWVAVKLLIDQEQESDVEASHLLFNVVMTILMADFIMSLDNVVAVAAVAQGDLLLIAIGLIISIPMIIWGSQIILQLLERFPIFLYLGAAILGYTAGEMALGDEKIAPWIKLLWPFGSWVFPAAVAIAAVSAGHLIKVRRLSG